MLPVEYEVRSMRKIGLPCFTHNAAATSLDAAAAFSLYSGERRNRRVRIGFLNDLFYGRSYSAGPAEMSIPVSG